jgi:hypothetical protein
MGIVGFRPKRHRDTTSGFFLSFSLSLFFSRFICSGLCSLSFPRSARSLSLTLSAPPLMRRPLSCRLRTCAAHPPCDRSLAPTAPHRATAVGARDTAGGERAAGHASSTLPSVSFSDELSPKPADW